MTFGTNWVAQAEHGGYYQAVADGTYEKYGLEVTIVPGGPQANNRMLLPVGKHRFLHGRQHGPGLLRRRGEHPDRSSSRRIFQKEPQVMLAHPGQGFDTFEDLKKSNDIWSRRRASPPSISG